MLLLGLFLTMALLCLSLFLYVREGLSEAGLDSGDQAGSSQLLGALGCLNVEVFPLGHSLPPF